jgi:hypothetical protein
MKIDTGFFHHSTSFIMRRILILLLSFCFTLASPLLANTEKPHSSTDLLRKEVSAFFKSQDLIFLKKNVEVVRVSFLINAKNELVISNVDGEDPDACDYVKNILNFKHLNFAPTRQLVKYAVDIRLVRT